MCDLCRACGVYLHESHDGAGVSEGGTLVAADFVTTSNRWTDSSGSSGGVTPVPGAPGGVVAWSLAGAGLADATGVFYAGSSASLATFLPFDYQAVLRTAFKAWSAQANISFIQVADGGGNIGIGTYPTIRVVGGFIDGQQGSNVLARAFFPNAPAYGGDIVFDSGNTSFFANPAWFLLTALHEIGHALGLNHETANLAIMNPVINTSLTGLQADDIAGIRAIYGAVTGTPPSTYYMPQGQSAFTLLDGLPSLTIVGNALDNRIVGASGNEVMRGGAGSDILDGGSGIDFADYSTTNGMVLANLLTPGDNLGDAAGDSYSSVEGLIGSGFNDVLRIENGGGSIWALAGDDYLFGGNGADDLHGQDGLDHLLGGPGADLLDGGAGPDFADYSTAAAGVLANLLTPWDNLGDGAGDSYDSVEGLIGSDFNDVLRIANDGGSIWALGGDDYLYGGDGADDLHGQDGNDHLLGGSGTDVLDGGAGIDFANYSTALGPVLASLVDSNGNMGEAAGDRHESIEGLIGSTFGDVLRISNGGGSIWALGGNDTLFGGAGNDDLNGQEGDDVLVGAAGVDVLAGGTGDDTFVFARGETHGDTMHDFTGNGGGAGDSLRFTGYGTPGEGATFVQVDATHWNINSSDGLIRDTLIVANAGSIHVSDYLFV